MHHYTTKRTLFTSVSYCTIQYTVVQNNMLLYGNIMFYSICPSHPVIASTVSWVQFIPVYQLKKVRTVTPPPPSPHLVQLLLSCTWGYEGLCTASWGGGGGRGYKTFLLFIIYRSIYLYFFFLFYSPQVRRSQSPPP